MMLQNRGLSYLTPLMLLVYRIALVAVREDLETSLVHLRVPVGASKIRHVCNAIRTNLDQGCLLHIHVDAGNNQHCK